MAGKGTEVGTAYVTILPRLSSNFNNAISNSMSGAGSEASTKFGGTFTKGVGTLGVAAGNILANGFSKVAGTISNSLSGAISRVDTLNNFPKIMANFGVSADQAAASINRISERMQGLPTSLDQAAAGVQDLFMVTKDLGKAEALFYSVNDAAMAFANGSAEAIDRFIYGYKQAMSAGKVSAQDFNQMNEAIPGLMTAVAESMGLTFAELKEGLSKGTISIEQFNEAFIKLDEEGSASMAALKASAKDATAGIQTAFQNMNTHIVRGVAELITSFGTSNLVGAIDAFGNSVASMVKSFSPLASVAGNAVGSMVQTLATKMPQAQEYVAKFVNYITNEIIPRIKPIFDEVKNTIKSVLPAIKGLAKGFLEALPGILDFINNNKEIIKILALVAVGFKIGKTAIGGFAGAILKGAGTIGTVVKSIKGIATGKIFKDFFNQVKQLAGINIKTPKIDPKPVTDAAGPLAEAGDSISKSGTKISNAFQKLAGIALVIVSIGASLALAGVGFRLIADGAAQVGNAGPLATLALAEMGFTLIGFVAILAFAAPALQNAALGIVALGGSLLLAGAGMLMIGAGAALVGSQGMPGIVALGILCGTLIIMVPLLAIFGPLLDVASLGLIAFGAAILMAGVGIGIAAAGIAILVMAFTQMAGVLPTIVEYGGAAAAALAMIAGAMALCSGAAVLCAAGFIAMAASMLGPLGTFILLMGEMILLDAELVVTSGLLLALSGGFIVAAAGAAALGGVISGIKSDCAEAVGSMWELQGSVDVVGNSIEGLKGFAADAIDSIIGFFNNLAGSAAGSATDMWNMVSSAFSAGSAQVTSITFSMIQQVYDILYSGADNAWNAGYNIGQGFANGMDSALGAVRSAANNLVAEAQRAVEAKAKIASPSRLFRELGRYIPLGFAQGIRDDTGDVRSAATNMAESAVITGKASEISIYADSINNASSDSKFNKKANDRSIVLNFYDTQTSPDAIYQKLRQSQTRGLARTYG